MSKSTSTSTRPVQLTRLSRTLGALLALHAGDSLGASVEFDPHEKIKAQYPTGLRHIIGGGYFKWAAGAATDDTDLTRAVLLAYADAASPDIGSTFSVVKRAGHFMLKWLDGDWPGREFGKQPRDVGNGTFVGLTRFREDGVGGAGEGYAGNGSLMRCLPTGLFVREEGDEGGDRLEREARGISRITHDDERCQVACVVYCGIVRALVEGRGAERAVEEGLVLARKLESKAEKKQGKKHKAMEGWEEEDKPVDGPVAKAVVAGKTLVLSDIAEHGPGEAARDSLPGKGNGYVLESLALAVAAVLDERSLEDVLVDVVRVGLDTDTNAAIAGGLLGARDGVDAVPKEWTKKLQFAEEFEDVATNLCSED